MQPATDEYADIRDAVRALCAQFPDEYHRKVDAQRAYPEAFVDALTQAGWLAAMIPQDYGGSGLGLAEASVIMEEINRAGGNSGGNFMRDTCSVTHASSMAALLVNSA